MGVRNACELDDTKFEMHVSLLDLKTMFRLYVCELRQLATGLPPLEHLDRSHDQDCRYTYPSQTVESSLQRATLVIPESWNGITSGILP